MIVETMISNNDLWNTWPGKNDWTVFFFIEMFVEDKADIFCLGDFLVLLNQQ